MTRHSFTLLMLICVSLTAIGQTSPGASPQPAFGSELPYTEVLTPPLPVAGVRTPLRLSSESPRSNVISGSIAVSAAYDDNMLASPTHRVGDFSYLVFPSLEIVQTRERWSWDFGYSPGFTFNQRLNERNQSAHDLHFLFGYRLSPHVNLQLHDNFNKTTNLFSDFLSSSNPQPGLVGQPNTSLVVPLSNRTGNTSGLDLTYQFGIDSMVGASGRYYFVNYGQLPGTSGPNYSLIDSRSWNAEGFYAHRFAHRHWLGVSYNFQRLNFDQGYRTDVQRTFLFYSVDVGARMNFSLWAGPERSTTFLPVLSIASQVSAAHWHGAGGMSWTWQGPRNGFGVGYTRQTSDGGGLAQAVIMQQATAEYRRRMTQRWTAILGGSYAKNNFVGSTLVPALRTWTGNAGFDFQLTDHWGTSLRYARNQQEYVDAIPSLSANRNRAWVSVSYSFSRPLGR